MAGQQEPYFYIEFVSHKPRELANGRAIHVSVATYYIKRGEEVQERHRAAFLAIRFNQDSRLGQQRS